MNGETKKAIKTQLINLIGVAIICLIGFYFTGKANIKYNQNNIKNLEDNTVQLKAFNEYVKRIDQLIEIYQNNSKKDIESMEDDIDNIKEDIRTLYVNMGYKTRGTEKKTVE